MYDFGVGMLRERLPMTVDIEFLEDVLLSRKITTAERVERGFRRHGCPVRAYVHKMLYTLRLCTDNGLIGPKVLAFGSHCCIFFEACIMYDTESSSIRYFCINVNNRGVVILKLLSLEGPFESRPSHEESRIYQTQPIFAYLDNMNWL